ncbi:MAG: hypothetical protein JHC26_07015 [Thermofilum sp.]|uniref:hypothetical protein n=1 Tax=Thermofilum sp. TaxID=1961369 RepID=UPI00258A0878|nr:hypothetical protein [Thermofilum sp.]MCI4408826.1 hypothetical protein [Thermofilum sp.]
MAQASEKGRVRFVKIDLDELYGYGVKLASEEFLKLILDQYEAIDYKLLYSSSPDVDVIYHDGDFKQYVDKCIEEREDVFLIKLALEYAEKNGYESLVLLSDGHETAVAVARGKDQ